MVDCMKKKLLIITFVLMMIAAFNAQSALAIAPAVQKAENISVDEIRPEVLGKEDSNLSIIKRVSLRDKLKRSPEIEIQNFFKKFNKYSEKNNIEKLKEMYSDSYVNNDGYDKETIFKLNEEAQGAYKNVDYDTQLLSIRADRFNAVVDAVETAKGETINGFGKIEGTGEITSELHYTDYLRKEDGKWRIVATDISREKLELKYGDARGKSFKVTAPECVPAGAEYEVSLKTESSLKELLIGSISNEQIKYPQEQAKDVLRAINDGELSRIIKANTLNNNEYATISVAITKADLEPNSVVIKMTGAAILMNRVNVLKATNTVKSATNGGKQ